MYSKSITSKDLLSYYKDISVSLPLVMGRFLAVPGKAGDLLKVTQDVSSRVGAEHVPSAQVSCWEVLILLLTWHDCCKWDYRHYRLRKINEPLKELELLKWPYIIQQQAASPIPFTEVESDCYGEKCI